MKNVKACWNVPGADGQVRIVQKGKIRLVAGSDILERQYSATFWEKLKDGAVFALIVPAIPFLLLMFYISNRGCD